MRPQHVLLTRRCPVCGGRSHAEGKLPISQGLRVMEFNLDEPASLVESLSLHLLLALVELIPYKQFACQRCGHEFQLASRAARDILHTMLTTMQPVQAPPPPAPAPANVRKVVAKRRAAPSPERMPAALTQQALAQPANNKPAERREAKPVPGKPAPPDWKPYHLDSDMDALFDQFKEE